MNTKTRNLFNSHFFIFVTVIAACIASLGTIPYGYKFVQTIALKNQNLSMVIGIVLALSAAIANTALAAYSVISIKTGQSTLRSKYLAFASCLSAIPSGFVCYFGYLTILPTSYNIIISCIVSVINAAINRTAMHKFYLEIKNNKIYEVSLESGIKFFGLCIGIATSTALYIASFHGITHIFHAKYWDDQFAVYIAFFIGFLAWVPSAALFSNATQGAAARLYHSIANFSLYSPRTNFYDILLIVFACFSGASFAQIAIDFFDPTLHTLVVLKPVPTRIIIFDFLVPLAFFSSASVNYFALKNIITQIRH